MCKTKSVTQIQAIFCFLSKATVTAVVINSGGQPRFSKSSYERVHIEAACEESAGNGYIIDFGCVPLMGCEAVSAAALVVLNCGRGKKISVKLSYKWCVGLLTPLTVSSMRLQCVNWLIFRILVLVFMLAREKQRFRPPSLHEG